MESGGAKPEMVRSPPGQELGEELYKEEAEAKQLFGHSLRACLIWESLNQLFVIG